MLIKDVDLPEANNNYNNEINGLSYDEQFDNREILD